jgi:uncharacterized protein
MSELMVRRCSRCDSTWVYPRARCEQCGAPPGELVPGGDRLTVTAFTVVRRAPSEQFAAAVPYVLAVVRTAAGAHLFTRIDGIAPERVRTGLEVTGHYVDGLLITREATDD